MSRIHPHSRAVGYFTVFLVGTVIGLFAWHLWNLTRKGHEHVLIRFDGSGELIAALQPDDPVLINGVNVGQVQSFTQVPGGVRVLVRFWGHQQLFQDAYAVNTSYSLMGQRIIALDPGDDTLHPLPKGQSIPGIFDPGIAEVMSQIYKVLDAVVTLRKTTVRMVHGDSTTRALHLKLMGILEAIDKTIASLDAVSKGAGKVGVVLDKTGAKTRQITKALPAVQRDLSTALVEADSAVQAAQVVLKTATPLLDSTHRIARTIADPAGPMRHVLHDDSLIVTARRLEASLNTLMTVLEGELPMKFRFHVLGSNPSKKGL